MRPEELQRIALLLTIMNFGFNFGYEYPRDINTDERMLNIETNLVEIKHRLDLLLKNNQAGGESVGE